MPHHAVSQPGHHPFVKSIIFRNVHELQCLFPTLLLSTTLPALRLGTTSCSNATARARSCFFPHTMGILHALILLALILVLLLPLASASRLLVLSNSAIANAVVSSNVAECPCSVHVHRTRTSAHGTTQGSFDLLAVRKRHWDLHATRVNTANLPVDTRQSFFNISAAGAVTFDAFFDHFEDLKLDEPGQFVLLLRGSTLTFSDASSYSVRLRPTDHQSESCPVAIAHDHPEPRSRSTRVLQRQLVPEPRVVGGDFASPHLRPYMAVIYNPTRRFCSGALLSPRWVITAAHCLVRKDFTVGLLTTQAFKDGVNFSISRVIHHSEFGDTGLPRQNDITLIELSQPAPTGAKFIAVNADEARPRTGEFARVAGYGSISYRNLLRDPSPRSLRQVDVPITPFEQCFEAYKLWEPISKTKQVCAGYFDDGGCDACSGDSGGPLIQYAPDGKPVLMGLTSFGLGCALANFPGVYVRVAAFIPWLRNMPVIFHSVADPSIGGGFSSPSPETTLTIPLASPAYSRPYETPNPSRQATQAPSSMPPSSPMSPEATTLPLSSEESSPTMPPKPRPEKSRTPAPSPPRTTSPSATPPPRRPRNPTPSPTRTRSPSAPSPPRRPPGPTTSPARTTSPSAKPPRRTPGPESSRMPFPTSSTPARIPMPSTDPMPSPNPKPAQPNGMTGGPCMPGWKLKNKHCVVCFQHAVSNGGFNNSCRRCAKGFTRDAKDGSKCVCKVGRELEGRRCVFCKPGSFAALSGSKCEECPEGQYTSKFGSTSCRPCPTGQMPTGDRKACRS